MPIPDLDALLPVGVHDCTLEELRDRFGIFQTSEQRMRLFVAAEGSRQLDEYVSFFQERREDDRLKGMVRISL